MSRSRFDPVRDVRQRRSMGFISGLAAAIVVVVLVALLGIAYLAWTRGWDRAKQDVFGSGGVVHAMKETTTDAALTAKVKAALALSSRVEARNVDVDTNNGEVTLRGEVPNQETRSIAEMIARDTSGVRAVRNELSVNPGGAAQQETERMRGRVADLEKKYLVHQAIASNDQLHGRDIQVEAANQNIKLTGAVEDADEKYLAEQLAWSVEGVQSVQNELQVTEASPAEATPAETTDDVQARKVEFALYSTQALDVDDIRVQADNGTVMLTGTVTSAAEKLLAARVAAEVEGVRRVVNNLQVRKEA